MGQCLKPEVTEENFIAYVEQFGVEKEWIEKVYTWETMFSSTPATIFVVSTPENYLQVKSLLLKHVPSWKGRAVYVYHY